MPVKTTTYVVPPRSTNGGCLYLVATPIGNLEDITYRAVRVLSECDLVACEDTRQTRKLLDHYGIKKPMLSCHEHNEAARGRLIVDKLTQGLNVALVSDAGTPMISDPGYRVVAEAAGAGFQVIPIPGPSSVLAALAASGLPVDRFRFVGFLPSRQNERRRALEALREESTTVIVFEAPHRILDSLEAIAELLGDRRLVLAREVTKLHEEFLRGTATQIRATLASRASVRGEITLLIGPAPEIAVAPTEQEVRAEFDASLAQGMGRMDAIKHVARRWKLGKRDVYRIVEGGSA